MMIAASVWSVTSNLDRLGVVRTSTLFWALSVSMVMSVVLAMLLAVFRCST